MDMSQLEAWKVIGGSVVSGLVAAFGGRAWILRQNAANERARTEGKEARGEGNFLGTLAEREQKTWDRAEAMRRELGEQHTVVAGLQVEVSTWKQKYNTLSGYYTRMRDRYKVIKTSIDVLQREHMTCESNLSKQILETEALKTRVGELERLVGELTGGNQA